MILFPAIDLLNSQVVRLQQGLEQSKTVYSNDPPAMARSFQDAGAQWIHVVDLDGAFGRPEVNDAVIRDMIHSVSIPIELGGGIRTLDRITYWLKQGVGRVILGSVAIKNPDLVQTAIETHGSDAIVVGIDMKDGKVAIHGWQDKTDVDAISLAKQMQACGLTRTIITDIATDGMLTGPRLETMLQIADATGLNVIASGGVGTLDDLATIEAVTSRGIEGAIVGKAIYENAFTVQEAVERFQKNQT